MQPVKNKKLTYLLICAVAAVWGIVIYRVFFNGTGEEYQPGFADIQTVHEPYNQYEVKDDTFNLALNYRDPFLNVAYHPDTVKPTVPAKDILNVEALPPPINWSIIKYSGYITNPVTKKIVSIVNVNGKDQMISEGEQFEGVKLLKNQKDSILVKYQGKQKYIKQ